MAPGLASAVDVILGPQEAFVAVALADDDSPELFQERLGKTVDEVDRGAGVVVLADLPGATPFSSAARLAHTRPGVEVLAGVNLPMLLEILTQREGRSSAGVASTGADAGARGVVRWSTPNPRPASKETHHADQTRPRRPSPRPRPGDHGLVARHRRQPAARRQLPRRRQSDGRQPHADGRAARRRARGLEPRAGRAGRRHRELARRADPAARRQPPRSPAPRRGGPEPRRGEHRRRALGGRAAQAHQGGPRHRRRDRGLARARRPRPEAVGAVAAVAEAQAAQRHGGEGVSTAPARTVHPFHMWDGIQAIPAALDATEADGPGVEAAAAIVAAEPRVDLVGCGTSYFAGMAIAHAFQGAAATPATAHNAFEYAAYPPPAAGRGALVALSHTGTTPDVVAAVDEHRSGGRPAIALTDVAGSPLAAACDGALVGPGGLEPALPKTRSYATALQRGFALALAVARRSGRGAPALAAALDDAGDLAAAVTRETEAQVRQLAEDFAGAPRIVVVGGGPELATANEAALKITEAAGMHADAWQVEEAAHGTWASTAPGELAIVIAPEGRGTGHARRIARGMAAAAASVWVLGNGGAAGGADAPTPLPDVDELVMPLFSVLPLYVFAYHLALARDRNPDVMGTDEPRYREARGIMRLTLPTAVAA